MFFFLFFLIKEILFLILIINIIIFLKIEFINKECEQNA